MIQRPVNHLGLGVGGCRIVEVDRHVKVGSSGIVSARCIGRKVPRPDLPRVYP